MKKKILVIDDNLLILYGLQKALRRPDVAVTTAASARIALDKLGRCLYDLCLIDIHQSNEHGLELLKTIKLLWPKTKVIIMTASLTSGDELSGDLKEAARNGACHFLTKPFDLGEVREIIHHALYDEDFQTDGRITGNIFAPKKRKSIRFPFALELIIAMTIMAEGETKRQLSRARAVDISAGGMGLETQHPLRIDQILSFRAPLAGKTGIVVWSTMEENDTCRAGLRFA